jgi:hypothetical protein
MKSKNLIPLISTSFVVSMLCVGFQCAVLQAPAQVIQLTDGNSFAKIDVGSPAGMFNWSVLTQPNLYQDQLTQQWFWYRVGTAGPERSIDTIGAPALSGVTANTLTTTYYDSLNRFNIAVSYRLQGGAPTSGTADITEQIAINNTSGGILDFHFFQYSDFDLGGNAGGDTVVLSQNAFTSRINQADQFTGNSLVEVVNTPNANHGEVGFFPTTLNKLNDGNPDVLNDVLGPVGPGDVTWALEWDASIGVGGSLLISKDKLLTIEFVPEPGIMALLGLGLGGLLIARKRQ